MPAPYREALAASAMLNRALVLPASWCYCDYDWTPHVLEKCKIRCGLGDVGHTLCPFCPLSYWHSCWVGTSRTCTSTAPACLPACLPAQNCRWPTHLLSSLVPPCRGSDLHLPFECPADFVFHIPSMDMANVSYRMPGFLEDPRVRWVCMRVPGHACLSERERERECT
jgi:hypothetical protein